MDFFLQLTINGIMLGGLYAAMNLGFSVVWGVMGLINLAHGEFVMIGAYIAWVLANPGRTEIGITLGSQVYPVQILVLALAWGSLGLVFSRFVLRSRIRQPVVRRVIGYGGSAALMYGIVAAWTAMGSPAVDPLLSIPVVMLIAFGIGYVVQRGLFNRIVEGPHLTMLLITFGVSIIMSNTVLRIFTANPRTISLSYERGIHISQNLTLSPVRVIVFLLSLVMMGLLLIFMQRTRTGRAIRAAAQNKMAARLVGIDVKETYAITFAISVAFAAAAGAMLSGFSAIVPLLGAPLTLRAFAITALGGLGKIEGAVVGGLVLGLTESFVGGYINTGWQVAAAFLLLVFFLVVRPQGLLGGLRAMPEG
jgi:branched-chain amino acid transport system permease protein